MTDTTSTNLRQEAMRILVETELPICEECGNGTFSWDEAQRDPSIMEQKAYTADRIIDAVREALLSERAVEHVVRAEVNIDPREPITAKEGEHYRRVITVALEAALGNDHD